jgi:hypothetical protein
VPVTVSGDPTGAFVAVQLPVPPERVAVHRDVAPIVKATEPVGVPPEEVTVAL